MALQPQGRSLASVESLAPHVHAALAWAPPWLATLMVLAGATVVALGLHLLFVLAIRRAFRRRDQFWRQLLVRTRRPARWGMVLLAVAVAMPLAPLTPGTVAALRHGLLIGFIVLVGWSILTGLDIAAAIYMRRFRLDAADNLIARKHLTQVKILRRAVATLVVVLTAGFALMTISGVRQWGVSLLAAGGAASIIVGLALQPLLTNLIAGIQIAMTQPIRIDDAVVIEGEFGKVEEINATYVVVRLWDERRLVVPLSDVLQKPFQNWTRQSASLLGSAMLYVDYAAPLDAIRRKLEEIVRASPLWDQRVAVLHVTDLKERTMELRALVSAGDAGKLFDLRAEVREKLVAFLQAEHDYALPRERHLVQAALDAPRKAYEERPEGGPSGLNRPQ